jgi:hypothetical protein
LTTNNTAMTTTHEEISKRAREIWEREGRPEARDKDHWLQAETELRQEALRSQMGNNIRSEDDSMLKVPAGLTSNNNSNGNKQETGRKRSLRRNK